MDIDFVRDRITQLRIQKGVSEYKMSYALGHSRGYINNISSGKTLPSMAEFLAICDYFEIHPSEFFNEDHSSPLLFHEIHQVLEKLDEKDLNLILMTANRLAGK